MRGAVVQRAAVGAGFDPEKLEEVAQLLLIERGDLEFWCRFAVFGPEMRHPDGARP